MGGPSKRAGHQNRLATEIGGPPGWADHLYERATEMGGHLDEQAIEMGGFTGIVHPPRIGGPPG